VTTLGVVVGKFMQRLCELIVDFCSEPIRKPIPQRGKTSYEQRREREGGKNLSIPLRDVRIFPSFSDKVALGTAYCGKIGADVASGDNPSHSGFSDALTSPA
jgi:hypothetical protein